MKNNFIIILAFVFYNCNSQCGFYIKPFITPLKYEITNNLSGEFKSVSGETIFIKADNLFTPRAGIYFGAEFGYRIKNFFGEVGLNQDGALSKFIISGKSYDWDNNSYRQVWEHYSGAAQINYHLRLGLKIRELNIEYYKNTSASLFLIGGIEMLKNYGKPNNNFKELNQSSVVFMPNDSSTIEVTSKTIQTFVNYNIQPSIGLFLEIKFKKISILNLSLNYLISVDKYKYRMANQIVIKDVDGSKYYFGGFMSTGSGLYFTLSRTIYPFNFLNKKKITANEK